MGPACHSSETRRPACARQVVGTGSGARLALGRSAAGRNDPLAALSGDRSDEIEVGVIVEDDRLELLGGSGYQEVWDLAAPLHHTGQGPRAPGSLPIDWQSIAMALTGDDSTEVRERATGIEPA